MNTILQWKAYEWSTAFLFIKSLLSTPSTLYFSNWEEISNTKAVYFSRA